MGFKEKLKNLGDWLSKPIEGLDGPDRGERLFKKSDRVTTSWSDQPGTVYRYIEYGDGWAYGVKLDDGRLYKAVRQKDLSPIKESIIITSIGELRESVRNVLLESVERHCYIYLAQDGKWYLELAADEYGDWQDAFTYGPFRTEDAAIKHLDNFSNPGGWESDDSGSEPVPKKSPNGSPVESPGRNRYRGGGLGSWNNRGKW